MKYICCIAAILLSGCATYNDKSSPYSKKWKNGDLEGAYKGFNKLSEKASKKDKIVYNLEAGSVARVIGDIDSSGNNFQIAQELIEDYQSKPSVSISKETAALFSNQAALPYRGGIVDKIMLDAYQALNFWEMGDLERARNEFISLMINQDNAQSIAEQLSVENYTYDKRELVERAKNDYKLLSQIDKNNQSIEILNSYDNFMNPYAELLYGLFFMSAALDISDYDRADKAMRRTSSLVNESNIYLEKNISHIKKFYQDKVSNQNQTHVIFETGLAPKRDQTRIDIPLFIATDKVPYIGAAFPKLVLDDDYQKSLTCVSNNSDYEVQLIASFDRMVSAEFKKNLPKIITKTIISTVVKAYAAYIAQEAARKQYESDLRQGKDTTASQMVLLFSQIGGTVWQVAVNNADLRTWNTLPKEVYYASFPAPENKILSLKFGESEYPVQLISDSNLVIVKSNSTKMAPVIKIIKL